MKVDMWETYDRYKEFTQKEMSISDCCSDLMKKRPFGSVPFYMFVHARTAEDGFTKELIWQPRLTRPTPQTNSMLFKAYPTTEEVKVCWMIPPREMFDQYKQGKLTEHDITQWSINMFETKRAELARNEDDDLTDDEIDKIYKDLSMEANFQKVTGSWDSSSGLLPPPPSGLIRKETHP